jgi:hypothetical protein
MLALHTIRRTAVVASTVLALAALAALAACTDDDAPTAQDRRVGAAQDVEALPFEVWVVDQSNSRGLAYGGAIHVFDGSRLMGASAADATPTHVIDLAGATTALCQANTGAAPVRPHMLFFNAARTHALLAFVASGHVVVFDAATRAPVACLRSSPGAGGARQAHAAFPAPDDSYILVANQNGKLLERIAVDYAANAFALEPAAMLDLANGTTPNGALREDPLLRPDNAPICPLLDAAGDLTWVTLRGGGLFVVDVRATPMRIVAEYDRATVHPNGCGGSAVGGHMYINSGGGTAGNLSEFDVYQFPPTGYSPSNAPNVPAPRLVFTRDDDPAHHHRDAHRMQPTGRGRYLWAFDRAANLAEVFETTTGEHLGTVDLVGPLSDDPTPDLSDLSPGGSRMFVALRGPNPLSGDPHVSTGSTPGLAVVRLTAGGRRGEIAAIVPISNRDAAGVERADPHGIAVRLRP